MLRGIPLWSEELGLSGRADAVEVVGNDVQPVEYKSGIRHGAAADLQLCAQAMCLEEMLEIEVPFGHVWYGAPKRRAKVEFTANLRHEVRDTIHAIRAQLISAKLPEAPNDARCSECQLLHYCLPEVSSTPQRINHYMQNFVFSCDI